MTETESFRIGDEVSCSEGSCGTVRRVVVDPTVQAVTHLVVEPKHGFGMGRLVPLDVVEKTDQGIRLRCDRDTFEQFDPAEETQFLPGASHFPGYDETQIMAWPYYSMGTPGMSADEPRTVTVETVPPGEVDVRRGESVSASDGEIGRVQGLVIDPATRHVTHVLLQEGHLWGRRQVAIPMKSIRGIDGGVSVDLTKEEIAALPPVDLEDFDSSGSSAGRHDDPT